MLTVVTLAERPELESAMWTVVSAAWKHLPYLQSGPTIAAFETLVGRTPQFQLLGRDPDGGRILAVGATAPLRFEGPLDGLPDEGWDWQVGAATRVADGAETPNWLAAFSVSVLPFARGRGLSGQMLAAMRRRAGLAGLQGVIAPVRPSLKAAYPLTDIGDYVSWSRADGLPFDPWLRVHLRAGGRVVRVCRSSMTQTADLQRFEAWAGFEMPVPGPYALPGGLAPVVADPDAGTATYVEPNVWVVHSPLAAAA